MRSAIVVVIVSNMMAVAIWIIVEVRRDRVVWDHWDVVKPGVLYRSGQLNADQLADAVKRYGLRTIVNFQVPGARVRAERELARRLGIDFLHIPMPGDGFGQEAQFRAASPPSTTPAVARSSSTAPRHLPHRRPVALHRLSTTAGPSRTSPPR